MDVLSETNSETPRIVPRADEGVTRLSREWLIGRYSLFSLYRYNQQILHRVRYSPFTQSGKPFTPASVLLALVEREDDIHIILTRRARHLKHHPGQVSFPGGKKESTDRDLIETAIREMREELGIVAQRHNVLGTLCPLPTVSGYYVTPVICWVDPGYEVVHDPGEVDSHFEIPLSHVLSPYAIQHQDFHIYGSAHPIYAIYYHPHLIWGATAQILRAFKKQLVL